MAGRQSFTVLECGAHPPRKQPGMSGGQWQPAASILCNFVCKSDSKELNRPLLPSKRSGEGALSLSGGGEEAGFAPFCRPPPPG